MPQNIRSLPPKDSVDWYGHYGDLDLAVRELQPVTSGDPVAAAHGLFALNLDPANGADRSGAASTNYCFKMVATRSGSISNLVLGVNSAGSGMAGYYAAVYDATGALIPGSTTADFSTALTNGNSVQVIPLGQTVAVAAGLFYVSLRLGTASTQPSFRCGSTSSTQATNFGATSGSVGALAPRFGIHFNNWSGATPPATLGSLGQEFRNFVVGVR